MTRSKRVGPAKTTLTRETIIGTAMRLVDSRGAQGLTMRRLGDELGADPTAMYRHFRSKGELVEAMGESLLADVTQGLVATDASSPDLSSRDLVVAICTRLRSSLMRHPSLSAKMRYAPPLQSAEFAITEALLAAFAMAGLTPRQCADAYHAVIELAVGSATIDAPLAALSDADRSEAYRSWRAVYSSLSPTEYPHSRLAADHLYRGTADERFADALLRLLDGIAASP